MVVVEGRDFYLASQMNSSISRLPSQPALCLSTYFARTSKSVFIRSTNFPNSFAPRSFRLNSDLYAVSFLHGFALVRKGSQRGQGGHRERREANQNQNGKRKKSEELVDTHKERLVLTAGDDA